MPAPCLFRMSVAIATVNGAADPSTGRVPRGRPYPGYYYAFLAGFNVEDISNREAESREDIATVEGVNLSQDADVGQ